MVGALVGHLGSGGYRQLNYKGKAYPVHHLVWALAHGKFPDRLDHIDGNRMNNRLENLRECSAAQNSHNTKLSKANKSGYKGVYSQAGGRWYARIRAHGKSHYLGLFDSAEDAAKAYDAAARDLHGDFAKTNEDLKPKPTPYLTGEINIRPYDPRPYFLLHY